MAASVVHRHADVAGTRLFYREAGSARARLTMVLLHGFPSSSHSFRHVIEPVASQGVRVVAPDMPGFGFSALPPPDRPFTFSWMADVIGEFLIKIGVTDKVLYVHDFGGPVAYLLAIRDPSTVRGLIVQNGNAHPEGLGEAWNDVRTYWADPSEENRARIDPWLTYEGTRNQYLGGLPDRLAELIAPETWELDWWSISRGHGLQAQWDLFTDYRTHVARFDKIARFHKDHQPALLVLWGVHDPFFEVEEVLAYQRAIPAAESHLFDSGHFLLETHSAQCIPLINSFLKRIDEQRRAN
jgi:pimeloyl-ACP methyl ester carboxylesterase